MLAFRIYLWIFYLFRTVQDCIFHVALFGCRSSFAKSNLFCKPYQSQKPIQQDSRRFDRTVRQEDWKQRKVQENSLAFATFKHHLAFTAVLSLVCFVARCQVLSLFIDSPKLACKRGLSKPSLIVILFCLAART